VPRLSQSDIERTREATDIVELLSQYLPLKRAGKNYVALCPFHSEKKPSFNVSPERQIYHCFGCGAGGNVYTFTMEMEKVTFPEAVRMLARKAGIDLKEEEAASGPRDLLYRANEFAAEFYRRTLEKSEAGSRGRDYLKKRGFGKEVVQTFQLGYAPPEWDGLKNAAKSVPEDVLLKAGLIVKSEKGRTYDRFRDRLMFPIRNVSGKVVGFGGRVVGDSTPKYMNSPETDLYRKGSVLYGLWEAKQEIRKSERAVMVEGYTDLVSIWSAGVKGVVASSGTALTHEQSKLLSRYTKEVVILFDSDAAGDDAAVRGLDILLGQGLDVSVASLPPGHDPDSFVRKEGGSSLATLIDSAPPFFDFKLSYLEAKHDLSRVSEKAKAIAEMALSLGKVSDPVKRQLWVKRLAERFGIAEEALFKAIPKSRLEEEDVVVPLLPSSPEQTELRLIGFMLADRDAFDLVKDNLTVDDFLGTSSRDMIKKIFEERDGGKEVKPADILSSIADRESMDIVSGAMMISGKDFDVGDECAGLVSRIRDNRIRRRMDQKLKEIREKESRGEGVSRLQREYQSLVALRRKGCLSGDNSGKEA
jgi:DNA primase